MLRCLLFALGIGGQDGSLGERRLNSGILGASVANLSIAGLQENVEIVLRNTEPVPVSLRTTWNGSGGGAVALCVTANYRLTQNVFFHPKPQANFVASCVFWDFTMNSKIFSFEVHFLRNLKREQLQKTWSVWDFFPQTDQGAGIQTAAI